MKARSLLVASGAAFLFWGFVSPVLATDADGDAVDDAIDVCINTPVGCVVDALGRPVEDLDGDCSTDLSDFAQVQQTTPDPVDLILFETGLTGPLAVRSDMVIVRAGEFQMGDSFGEGDEDELPVHAVYLDTYYIGKFEVTNAEFVEGLNWAEAQGLLAVDGIEVHDADGGAWFCLLHYYYNGSCIAHGANGFYVLFDRDDHPVTQVAWRGAAKYCNWRSVMEGRTPCYGWDVPTCDFTANGYRLATEAEWEKAAAWDPVEQRHYRFGEHTDGCAVGCLSAERANYYGSNDPFEIYNDWYEPPCTSPVGFYDGSVHDGYATEDARSYYGCYDMSGNVSEMCNDQYSLTYYASSPYANPTGPTIPAYHVLRGGSCNSSVSGLRSSNRVLGTYYGAATLGFRCVTRTP